MGSPVGEQHNRRLGLAYFAAYLAAYGGFVYLSAFRADLMAQHAFAGVNIAVVYGFALIVLALVLALLYLWTCLAVDEPKSGGPTS